MCHNKPVEYDQFFDRQSFTDQRFQVTNLSMKIRCDSKVLLNEERCLFGKEIRGFDFKLDLNFHEVFFRSTRLRQI